MLALVSFIFVCAFVSFWYFLIKMFVEKHKKNDTAKSKSKKFMWISLAVSVVTFFGAGTVPDGSSSKPKQTKQETSSSAKKASSKAQSSSESKQESKDISSSKKANLKKNTADYKKKLADSVADSKGAIESATYDDDGTTTLVVSEDIAMSDNVKQLCYQLWKVTMDAANSYNLGESWVTIQDDGGSQIAHTSTFTGKFVFDGD